MQLVYGSKHGSAEKYAVALGEKLGIPAIDYRTVTSLEVESLVYVASLYAGTSTGLKLTLNKANTPSLKHVFVITVGLTVVEDQEAVAKIKTAVEALLPAELKPALHHYHLQGSLFLDKLSFFEKLIMKPAGKKAKKMVEADRTPTDQIFADMMDGKADYFDAAKLDPIVADIRAVTSK